VKITLSLRRNLLHRRNFRAVKARNGDVHNSHYTPYLPTIRNAYIFNYNLWAERLWEFLWQQKQIISTAV